MRLKLIVIVMLGVPALAAGQPAAPATRGPVPLPSIGLPLPHIGLPLPSIGLPPAAVLQPRRGVAHPAPGIRRPHGSVVYLLPAYGWPVLPDSPTVGTRSGPTNPSQPRSEPPPRTGRLRLDITPAGGQQLYVDGYYVGRADEDFNGEVELEAGPHTIEIQATGYDPLRVPVNVVPDRSITYRGTLKATDAKPGPPDAAGPSSSPVVPATPMTGYVIPGCYIGNVPPQDVALPAGCDLARVITLTR